MLLMLSKLMYEQKLRIKDFQKSIQYPKHLGCGQDARVGVVGYFEKIVFLFGGEAI